MKCREVRSASRHRDAMASDDAKAAKKAKKAKKEKKEKKSKRAREDEEARATERGEEKKRSKRDAGGGGANEEKPTTTDDEATEQRDGKSDAAKKDAPAPGTFPTSSTHVYMGNLAWTIDEAALGEAFADCGEIVSVNWFEEKATGKFLGAGVVEFKTAEAAAAAVAATGRLVHKRETPVRFWEKRGNTAEERAAAKAAGGGGRAEIKPMGEKPEGCYTLFMGNLNFQIDDDTIYKFFMDGAGVGPHTIRWLTNKETGEFRGVGFADFSGAEIDAAAKLNGEKCMGRPIRLDWQAPSNRG
jgi:nucleolin